MQEKRNNMHKEKSSLKRETIECKQIKSNVLVVPLMLNKNLCGYFCLQFLHSKSNFY